MQATLLYRSRLIIKAITPYITKEAKVLDIGCGNGVVSHELAKHFGCALTGTDPQSYLTTSIPFIKMLRDDQLPFEDGAFDVGMFIDTLHHASNEMQVKIILDALRVCKKLLIFEVKPSLLASVSDIILNRLNYAGTPVPCTFRNEQGWMDLFHENHITATARRIKKPIPFYPFSNYLFVLEKKQAS